MDPQREAVVVVGVDTGGTFTDVFSSTGRVYKLPSTPDDPVRAILDGVRAVGVRPQDSVAHGTTVATNAVLERKGARTALLTTEGFEDVLEIRRQNRPALYDLLARWPDPLVPRERRLGVRERLDYRGETLTPLDREQAAAVVDVIRQEGCEAVAVCLLFSYANPSHEETLAGLLTERLPEGQAVSVSSQVAPQYGEYERTSTTVVNAYVMPLMRRYLRGLRDDLERLGVTRLHVMHSNGGLVSAAALAERPVATVLSGPAAGVVGARVVASRAGHENIITFDMGGTSTDVAVVPGRVLERSDGEVASFPLLVPMLTIETVGAGGGSIARVDTGGGLHVGPESAGADPGPAAYGRGEQATVTDANLVLGRLSSTGLLGGAMPLDVGRARRSLHAIAAALDLSVEQAAWAVVRLANSNMERAVRTVTLQRGYDPRRFTLFPFGGAGPLHGADLAAGLGVGRVLVPPHPGVMAALGLTVPDLQRDFFRTVLLPLGLETAPHLEDAFQRLHDGAAEELSREDLTGFGAVEMEKVVDARYAGQSFELRLPYVDDPVRLRQSFNQAHEERYGYVTPERPVEIVNARVRATAPRLAAPQLTPAWPETDRPSFQREVWFGTVTGFADLRPLPATILWRPALSPGFEVHGPAVLEQYDSTTVLPPAWTARVDDAFNLILETGDP